MKAAEILNHVFEVEAYEKLDASFAEKTLNALNDKWGGLCSAAAKQTDNGHMLVGRNMDLFISGKPAYIIRTEEKGKLKTIGISYFHLMGPTCEEVRAHGLPDDFSKLLPYLCCDVMNEQGLYVEINMRTGEKNADGTSVFGCSGTNPHSKKRVSAAFLTRYIAENCTSVDQVADYLNTLDIYTPNTENMDWNFCFLVADAQGHSGVVEIARNEVVWLPMQHIQTNFYLTDRFAALQQMKSGVGRYELLKKGLGRVQTHQNMYDLIRRVSYSAVYTPNNCPFDSRSEFVDYYPGWTYDFLTAPENQALVIAKIAEIGARKTGKPRVQLEQECTCWESVFTVVADCTEKAFFVRFFEDEERTALVRF